MRLFVVALLLAAAFIACGGAPTPTPTPPQPSADDVDTAPEEPAPEPPTTAPPTTLNGEKAPPPSTASYDEALSTPEPLNVNDERLHLTDTQLTGPVRGIINSCRVPANARVNIKTAVQDGRAIGVTVTVRIERPKSKSKRPPSKATLKADAKTSAKIVACLDRAVRAQSWPPSKRRDSFTTEF